MGEDIGGDGLDVDSSRSSPHDHEPIVKRNRDTPPTISELVRYNQGDLLVVNPLIRCQSLLNQSKQRVEWE